MGNHQHPFLFEDPPQRGNVIRSSQIWLPKSLRLIMPEAFPDEQKCVEVVKTSAFKKWLHVIFRAK